MDSRQILERAKQGVWTFFRDGVPEEVKMERWGWGVIYKSGSELHQFDEYGVFHQWSEINQDDVVMFVMYKMDLERSSPKQRIDIPVESNMQLFHFYRNTNAYYNKFGDFRRTYAFGWKDKKTGSTSYFFILPDDRMVFSQKNNIDLTLFDLTT